MRFLYRPPRSKKFFCTHDEKITYQLFCGSCGYPVRRDDNLCPRCHRGLSDCPVCTRAKGTRGPMVESESTPRHRTCQSCKVRLVRLDNPIQLDELSGHFCPNIYGCPAGGLLVKSGEVAILGSGGSLCPICSDVAFPLVDVRMFRQHFACDCLFCRNVFDQIFSSRLPWQKPIGEERPLVQVARKSMESCLLCGRRDVVEHGKVRVGGSKSAGEYNLSISLGGYGRVVELARALVLLDSDEEVIEDMFVKWHDLGMPCASERSPGISVSKLIEFVWEGTLDDARAGIVLRRRVERFQELWENKLQRNGLSFEVSLPEIYEVKP